MWLPLNGTTRVLRRIAIAIGLIFYLVLVRSYTYTTEILVRVNHAELVASSWSPVPAGINGCISDTYVSWSAQVVASFTSTTSDSTYCDAHVRYFSKLNTI